MAYIPVKEKDRRKIRAGMDALRGIGSGVPSWPDDAVVVDTASTGPQRIYSYGRHFTLCEYVRPARGRPRGLFILNGDTWRGGGGGWHSSRTPDHQAAVRAYVESADVDSVIIPFSALDGSGIDVQSIRPIHVRADANWTETHPLPATAPNMDALDTADSFTEDDGRRWTEWNGIGEPTGPWHGTWSRYYVWKRAGHVYSRRVYRASSEWTGPNANDRTWTLAPSWNDPTSDTRYMDGSELEHGDDGTWTFKTHEHRLGDALFSAVRPIREPTRAAHPFESERDNARETITLRAMPAQDSPGPTYCETADDRRHEAGPGIGATSGPETMPACVHCGAPLVAEVVWKRRATYLSSFDYNEWPPLYFLAELPARARPTTVDDALDALAPAAVHAALARGRTVLRQGDIFYVETTLTRGELMARGATFARLSLLTHGATPRKLEPHYRPPATAADRRRETRYARRLWRERFRPAIQDATSGATAGARPKSEKATRARWQKIRADHAADVQRAKRNLRALTLRGPVAGRSNYARYNETPADAARRTWLENLRNARARLDALLQDGPHDSAGHANARHGRDIYRGRYGANALAAWMRATADARDRYRPAVNQGETYRAAVRRALAVYGTAHSATEVATMPDGTTYARGIARHVPELDPERRGGRDHRALDLGDRETWHVAVRNTVPRQVSRRRNRRRTRPATMPAEG